MLLALNYLTVLIYGVLIMAFLLDIKMNRKNILLLSLYIFTSGLLQLALFITFDGSFIEKAYPAIVHLPIIIFFKVFFRKRITVVVFILVTAYTFTSPRKWIGGVVASFFANDLTISILTQIISSVVILIVVYRFLRPHFNRMLEYSSTKIGLLTVMPALYYLLSYTTTVYTDILFHSNILVLGLLSVGLNFCFYGFLVAYFQEITKSFTAHTAQTILQMQMDTVNMQIEDYKYSQSQAAIYRHDLRHHLNYISACMKEHQISEAQAYITRINSDMEATQVVQYCQNTSVNLILSAYAAQAKKSMAALQISAVVPMVIPMYSTDVCVILANGIENAIHACEKIENIAKREIWVLCIFENSKLMIEISNPYCHEIRFEGDFPISMEQNHGYGVKSIVAAVQKYNGIYSFSAENRIFTLRVIL